MNALSAIRTAVQSIPGINRLSTRAKEAETKRTNQPIDPPPGQLSTPSALSSIGLLYASAVKPITHLGPHVKWIMHHIHRNSLDVTKTREKNRSCAADLQFTLLGISETKDLLELLNTDRKVKHRDFPDLVDEWTTNIEDLLSIQTRDMTSLLVQNDTLKLAERLVQEGWKALYFHSQEYINRCLDASFNEDWCLSYRSCKFLRRLARHADEVHTKRRELTELQKSRRSRVSPESEPAQPYQNELEENISKLKMTLQLVEDCLKEREALFLAEHLVPFIQQDADRPKHYEEGPESRELDGTTSPRRTPDREDWEDPERLTAWYIDVRTRHEALQTAYATELRRLHALEPDHFLAFSNATRENFERFEGSRLATLKQDLENIEAQREEMRARLQSMNITVPGSDRINKFRFTTQQNEAPTTAVTPPSGHRTAQTHSNPDQSSSTSSSGQKRQRKYKSRWDIRGDAKRARTGGCRGRRHNDREEEEEEDLY